MALYLVSYDIAEKDAHEYKPLYDLLNQLGAVRILYSEWVITGDIGLSETLYNQFATIIQDKDRLLVQEMTNDASWDKLRISDVAYKGILRKARG